MIKRLKTGVLVCILVSLVTLTVVALSILAQIATDHTTRYIASYQNMAKVEQFQKAEEYSTRLLKVTEEAIRIKNEKEKELAALKRVTDDLYERLNNKENAIAEYSQSSQTLSITNMILNRRMNNMRALICWMIKELPEEKRKKAQHCYIEIMAEGGKIE